MYEYIIGTIGMLLIIIAWIPQTIENYKDKGEKLNIKFTIIYLIASVLLAIHAFLIEDMTFLVLNLLATFIAIFNSYMIFKHKKIR